MKLEIKRIWSPDLELTEENSPDNIKDFSVLVQVGIGQKDQEGDEVFSLTVCSPSQLKDFMPGMFIKDTLVLDKFNWEQLKKRIEKLLTHTQGAKDWSEVIQKLSGLMYYNDN